MNKEESEELNFFELFREIFQNFKEENLEFPMPLIEDEIGFKILINFINDD